MKKIHTFSNDTNTETLLFGSQQVTTENTYKLTSRTSSLGQLRRLDYSKDDPAVHKFRPLLNALLCLRLPTNLFASWPGVPAASLFSYYDRDNDLSPKSGAREFPRRMRSIAYWAGKLERRDQDGSIKPAFSGRTRRCRPCSTRTGRSLHPARAPGRSGVVAQAEQSCPERST